MMRKLAIASLVTIGSLTGLFFVAGRGIGELVGYFRASANVTADGLTQQLPPEIHDRKLDGDLDRARQELIDSQVKVNLSRGQMDQLRIDVEKLDDSIARRKRLLSEAYPILQTATEQKLSHVQFANSKMAIADFQRDLDELMAVQERETRQLEIKREGLARLEKNAREGELALGDMRLALDKTEQDVSELKARREQAALESTTLDMVASVTSGQKTAASSVNRSLTHLKTEVATLEARNDARRHLAPVGSRPLSNQVSRGWNRLESLKAIHDEMESAEQPVEQPANAEPAKEPKPVAAEAAQVDRQKINAAEVVIEIRNENPAKAKPKKAR